MTVEFDDAGNMILKVDAEDRALLQTLKDEDTDAFGTDDFMFDYFEAFIANNEYQWTRPEYCGALTSAPMLGIYGKTRALKEGEDTDFLNVVGHWDNTTWIEDVEQAWAFMSYQVTSPQEQLLETGQAIWQKG
jgi:hypothetical protein